MPRSNRQSVEYLSILLWLIHLPVLEQEEVISHEEEEEEEEEEDSTNGFEAPPPAGVA